jgi:hypothetical protein
MIRRYLPKSVQELVHWYERYISPLSLIAGFVADNLFLTRRVDLLQTNALLFSYLLISACGIVLINLIESGRMRATWVLKGAPLVPVVVQFAFGGLFSGYLSLYSRSAAFAGSWIFVLIIAGLLIGNERFTRLYVRFSFQIALYFTVLFSFLIFFLPVIFRKIGPMMFLLSDVVSLLVVTLFLMLLQWLVPEIVKRERTTVARAIAIIFVLFNVFYFGNVIPPLPLSLKDAGIYHSVVREVGVGYVLSGEPVPWYESFLRYNTTYHAAPGEAIYAYSAIFAPSGLSVVVLHQWQHYDEGTKQWVTTETIRYPIQGGRDGGYLGYSIAENVAPGKWRVNVVTQYGQLIGRISFTVVPAQGPVPLVESTQ